MKILKLLSVLLLSFTFSACNHFGTFKKSEGYQLYFSNNSAIISNTGMKALKKVAMSVEGAKLYDIRLAGFADLTGNRLHNQELSELRVHAVKDALIKLGLNETFIKVVAYGEERSTMKSAMTDRKVEISVRKSS